MNKYLVTGAYAYWDGDGMDMEEFDFEVEAMTMVQAERLGKIYIAEKFPQTGQLWYVERMNVEHCE